MTCRRCLSTFALAVISSSLVALAGCSKDPASPSPSTQTLAALRISGPASIAPQTTGQYVALAEYADGSTVDVTKAVEWGVSAPDILTFAPGTGRATANTRGETLISASFATSTGRTESSSLTVLVLEPATFRISGAVTDAGEVVQNAVVEVVSGIGTGLRSITDWRGRYAIYGVAGPTELRASADGFESQTRRDVVESHAVGDFALMPRDLMDVSGAWTMTFGAAAACRATLPAIARDLTYRVQIQQHGTRLDIEVSSVTGTLAGRVRNQSLTISMAGDYGLYVALTPTRSLGIEGLVNAELAGNEFRGTLDGQFIVYGGGMPSVTCRDSAHSFLLHRE